jgi:hypothetical protein
VSPIAYEIVELLSASAMERTVQVTAAFDVAIYRVQALAIRSRVQNWTAALASASATTVCPVLNCPALSLAVGAVGSGGSSRLKNLLLSAKGRTWERECGEYGR